MYPVGDEKNLNPIAISVVERKLSRAKFIVRWKSGICKHFSHCPKGAWTQGIALVSTVGFHELDHNVNIAEIVVRQILRVESSDLEFVAIQCRLQVVNFYKLGRNDRLIIRSEKVTYKLYIMIYDDDI